MMSEYTRSRIRLLFVLPFFGLALGCASAPRAQAQLPFTVEEGTILSGILPTSPPESEQGAVQEGAVAPTSPPPAPSQSRWQRKTYEALNKLPGADKTGILPKPSRNEAEARQQFLTAEDHFRRKQYSDAVYYYEEAAALWPNSPLEEDALFMRAESQFFANAYPDAYEAYERLLAKYKRSKHLEKSVTREFDIGVWWLKMDNKNPRWPLTPNLTDGRVPRMNSWSSALQVFERVRLNDPTGDLADDSLNATAGAYFAKGRYSDADYFYTLLRREYPDSEHQFTAHLVGVQAKLRTYQGSVYEGTPLVDAQELVEQILKQFPQLTPDDRARVMELRNKVAADLAKRDYDRAVYYANQNRAGAARYYFGLVATSYPGTQMAIQAEQRIAALSDQPDKPEPVANWFTSLFPSTKDKGLTLPEQLPSQPREVIVENPNPSRPPLR